MRVGPSRPTAPKSWPSTVTGATTTAHDDSGSNPCSVPMATDSPRLRTSRSRDTTTSCCSKMVRTERTVSTASNDSARRAGPPTNTWSASMAPPMESRAPSAAVTSLSTGLDPLGGAVPGPLSVRPTRCASRCAPAALRSSAAASFSRSIVRFSTAPSERTTTTSACWGDSPTSWTERIVAVSCDGPTTTAAYVVSSDSSPVARSSTVSISPCTWSKNCATWRRCTGPRTPGPVRWSTKKR